MSDAAPKHEINRLNLESAIADAQGDTLLLELAMEDMGKGDAWAAVGALPVKGFHLYLLNNDQHRALQHAVDRVRRSADEIASEFYGPKTGTAI